MNSSRKYATEITKQISKFSSNIGKYRPEKIPYSEIFHKVILAILSQSANIVAQYIID